MEYFDNVDLDGKDQHEDTGSCSDMSESCSSESTEDRLEIMPLYSSLEQIFIEQKREDIDEAEEQQIVHLLRCIFQYDAAMRPTAENILNHPWFRTEELGQ